MTTITPTPESPAPPGAMPRGHRGRPYLGTGAAALPGAFRKLDPRAQWRNPVMFLVWVGAAFTTVLAIAEPFLGGPAPPAAPRCRGHSPR
jgi:K+-transporting ATPase ATPase B chain